MLPKELKDELIFVASIFLVALLIRCWALDYDYIWDERYWVPFAQNIAENPFAPRLIQREVPPKLIQGTAPLFGYLLAGWWLFAGRSPMSSRLLVAIIGSMTIPLTYFLGSYLYGKRVGVTTALFLLFSPVHWTLSRMAMPDVPLLTFFLSSLILYSLGIKKESSSYIILAGFLGGCAALMKFTGLVLVGIVGLYLIMLIWSGRTHIQLPITISLVMIVLMVSPWIIYLETYARMLGTGFSDYVGHIFLEELNPLYLTFENLILHLLLSSPSLAVLPLLKVYRNRTISSKNLIYLMIACTLLFLSFFEILARYAYNGIAVEGVWIKLVLSAFGEPISNLVKIGMILAGVLVVVGALWVFDDGTNYGKLFRSSIVMYLVFVSTMTRKYPRYLLPIIPIFFLASARIIWEMATDKVSERWTAIYVGFCVSCFLVVGYFSNLSLI